MKRNKAILGLVVILLCGSLVAPVVLAQIPKTRMNECVKIKTNFTLKITSISGTTLGARTDTTFAPGAIIALRKIDAVSGGVATEPHPFCGHLKETEKADTVCPATTIANTARCYVAVQNEFGSVVLMNTISNITNWVFFITLLFAVLMMVFGGFTYITAAGDPAKTGKGKTIITYALIGLAVALLAKVLPSLIRFILGM